MKLKEALKQFNIGAVSGFLLGFSGAFVSEGVCQLIILFELHKVVNYLEPSPLRYTDILRVSITFIIFTGFAKLITSFMFRKSENLFIEWQLTGIITLIFFYLFCLFQNLTIYFQNPPEDREVLFNYIFAESLDVFSWLIGLLIFSIYNFVFALGLNFIRNRSSKKFSI